MKAFRNTIQKDTVLKVLHSAKWHPTAEQVLAQVHNENPVISRSTVFRILNQLSERGHIQRVRIPDGADCFDYNVTPHYHIKCVECGNVFDVDMPILEHIEDNITDKHGFQFINHHVIFNGVCPDCQ